MGTGRDDFTEGTKRKAAGRVGYRCSFPGCHNATIGASMESSDKTAVTGVAAHICAAAEGGPRYDKNMTVEERRSIDNCIWLCQTHSKLIDADEKTYTVDRLRQWKKDAETAASMALANGDYFAEYYNGHGDNLDVLNQMFNDMVIDGQFDLLKTMLEQYKTNDEHRIAVHETDIMEGIASPTTFANYLHYSAQDVSVSSLLFASQGDSVVWNQEDYTVSELMSANDAIKHFFFSTLSGHEGVTTIYSSSGEDFIEQISAILKKSSEDLNKRIDEYNQLEIRSPLSIFASVTGKGMLKTCEFLAFENREKIRNNASMAQNTNGVSMFVLSYDAIVYLVHLGVECELRDLNLMCSPQVKNQLINDINEELSELTDDTQKGTMFFQEGKLSLLERTSNMRRTRYTFLARLKAFVESLNVASNTPVFASCNDNLKTEIESLFSNKRMYCESTSLAATQNTTNAALVTDDQFLFTMADTESIPTIGLTGLLSKSGLPWNSLLSASKKLRDMNYGNYLPVHFYKRIVDQMIDSGSACDAASAEIQAWILTDTDGDATPHHEDIIIVLYREVVEQGLDYLNPNNYLTDIVISIWEKRNPGFIKKCIADTFKSLMEENQGPASPDAVE